MSAPNILLITSDQHHHTAMGAVNDRIRTPALDRLCAEGTRFDRAYCPNPTCTPTRASIITGMYPSQHGAWALGTKLFADVPTVGERLAAAGYDTSLIGKAHFQHTRGAPFMDSLESQPTMRDLDFWRKWHGPWYGFDHVEIARNHGDESHAGQHYGIWMEEQGFTQWREHFCYPGEDGRRPPHYADPEKRSWTLPEEFHYTRWNGERVVAEIDRAAAADRPFFCWASFLDPHPPYIVSEPWASMYDPDDMVPGALTEGEHEKNPPHFAMTQERKPDFAQWHEDHGIHGGSSHLHDPEQMKKNVACYYGMISFMDQQIGRILDALDRNGLADNTIVVFTTDHGHFMGHHGLTNKCIHHYEDVLRLPFVVRWPGHTPAGAVSSSMQNLVDLAPTFLSAAGVEAPGVMTGLDQTQTWCGGEAVRNGSITENHHTRTNFHMHTYVNERYKITVYRKWDVGELFDLQEDPGEVNNLWDDPAAASVKAELMHEFLQARMQAEPIRMPRVSGA